MRKLIQMLLITLFLIIGITDVAFATVISEPATATLFGLGLLCVAGISRRKK